MSTQYDEKEEQGGQAPEQAESVETAVENLAEADASQLLAEETLAEWIEATGGENIGDIMGHTGESSAEEYAPLEPEADNEIAEEDAESEDLAAQLAEIHDQLLRKTADFENYRKRMTQEKQSAIEFANQSLLLDIIPIIDDFERAIQSGEASEELVALHAGKAMLDGIIMIEKRLTSLLESKWGLKRFSSAGELFDPNVHEAMLMEKSPDVEEAVVAEEFMKGYTLKDRVIRAAKVKVLVPEEEGDGDRGPGTGDQGSGGVV